MRVGVWGIWTSDILMKLQKKKGKKSILVEHCELTSESADRDKYRVALQIWLRVIG